MTKDGFYDTIILKPIDKKGVCVDMTEITNERINELCEKYITGNIDNEEELENLEINELAMLYKNAEISKEKLPLKELFESKKQAFYGAAVKKLKNLDKIYAMMFNKNNMPIVDYTGTPFLFSDLDMCKLAVKNFLGKNIKTMPEETAIIEINNVSKYCQLFYFYGLNSVRLNEGTFNVALEDIAENPMAGEENPIINSELSKSAIFYLQYALTACEYDNKKNDLNALIGKLMYEITNAKYLMPAKKSEDGNVLIPQLMRQDKTAWTPAFTDRYEFNLMYKESEFNALLLKFDDVIDIYSQHGVEGIVINPKGANLILNKQFVNAAVKFKADMQKNNG